MRAFALDTPAFPTIREEDREPAPEAPAAELAPVLARGRERVLETRHYLVAPEQRRAFLAMMAEIRQVRRRAGALSWQLFEDVAHPEGFLETWLLESWTDHLREEARLSPADRLALARTAAFQAANRPPSRFIAVNPARSPDSQPRVMRLPAGGSAPYRADTEQGTTSCGHMRRGTT
jgi:quinol monooxygenase YgiN